MDRKIWIAKNLLVSGYWLLTKFYGDEQVEILTPR